MKTFKTFVCENCQKTFQRELRQLHKPRKNTFCSKECSSQHRNIKKSVNCKWCLKQFQKINSQFSRTKNHFCSRNCAGSYNSTQRRRSRRSKSEIMLFNLIKEAFPTLNVIPNDKSMLNGLEVDIAIPELNLAIEWNGIVHFKPIYGEEKLNKIQSIDQRKQELANQQNIRLIVIPDLVSRPEYVKECFYSIQKLINDLQH